MHEIGILRQGHIHLVVNGYDCTVPGLRPSLSSADLSKRILVEYISDGQSLYFCDIKRQMEHATSDYLMLVLMEFFKVKAAANIIF